MNLHLAIVLVILAGVAWGSSGIAVQVFFQHSTRTPIELTNIRMILSSILIFIVAWRYGGIRKNFRILNRWRGLWIELAIYGIIGIMLMQYTYFAAIESGSAAAATVIQYVYPAMVITWTSLSRRKFPHAGEIIAVIFACVGIFLLVTEGDLSKLSVPIECILFGLASGACFAFASIYPKRLFALFDPYFLTAIGMFIGGIATFPFLPDLDWFEFFKPDVIFYTLWIIFIGTTIAFIFFNAGLKYLSPEIASVSATIEPVASVVISYFVFGTTFGSIALIGIFLVLLAIVSPVLIRK